MKLKTQRFKTFTYWKESHRPVFRVLLWLCFHQVLDVALCVILYCLAAFQNLHSSSLISLWNTAYPSSSIVKLSLWSILVPLASLTNIWFFLLFSYLLHLRMKNQVIKYIQYTCDGCLSAIMVMRMNLLKIMSECWMKYWMGSANKKTNFHPTWSDNVGWKVGFFF